MQKPLLSPREVDDFIIIHVTAFASKIRRAMTRDVLAGENLPILEWRLLFSIARFGECHLAYVTQKTSIDPAHGSRAAAALEANGLITRRDDPDNRRRKLMALTPEGEAVFWRIWPKARRVMNVVADRLSPEDFEDLKRLLKLANIAAQPLADIEYLTELADDAA